MPVPDPQPGSAVVVHWIDSSMIHVQTDEVAEPQMVSTVGVLVAASEESVVVARDHHFGPHSDPWRSQIAIPRTSIRTFRGLAVDADGDGYRGAVGTDG